MASAENRDSGERALTGKYYTSTAIFEQERQRFARSTAPSMG